MNVIKFESGGYMSKKKDLKGDIIRSALRAFAKQDFQKVSTNQIVEDAKVSKGLLFHYFQSKLALYTYLYEMSWQIVYRDIFNDFPFENRDVFERLKLMILRKTKCFHKHETMTSFLKRAHAATQPELVKMRSQLYQSFQQKSYKRVFDNIDKTLFLDDVYIDDIYKIVIWTLNRVTHECDKQHNEKSKAELLRILEEELKHYTTLFKHYFYR